MGASRMLRFRLERPLVFWMIDGRYHCSVSPCNAVVHCTAPLPGGINYIIGLQLGRVIVSERLLPLEEVNRLCNDQGS